MENKRNQCNKCEGIGIPSKAYDNTFIEFLDLGSKPGDRGNTLSKSGPAKLVDCIKCTSCGHSWIPERGITITYTNTLDNKIDKVKLKSTKELALEWWKNLPGGIYTKQDLSKKYFNAVVGMNSTLLSDSEIEEIWQKEVCLNAYGTINVSKEDSDFILKEKNHSIKFNQKQFKEFNQKQFKEFNQKQFKEFDHKLFTAYINKFSDDDKMLAIRYIHKSMPDSNFKKFLSQWFE